jgi:hypothetical protein
LESSVWYLRHSRHLYLGCALNWRLLADERSPSLPFQPLADRADRDSLVVLRLVAKRIAGMMQSDEAPMDIEASRPRGAAFSVRAVAHPGAVSLHAFETGGVKRDGQRLCARGPR